LTPQVLLLFHTKLLESFEMFRKRERDEHEGDYNVAHATAADPATDDSPQRPAKVPRNGATLDFSPRARAPSGGSGSSSSAKKLDRTSPDSKLSSEGMVLDSIGVVNGSRGVFELHAFGLL
jgi:hypothetical protein